MLSIPDSFRRFRKQYNLTQTDVARTLGIKPPSYEYERKCKGKVVYPNGSTLIKLATAYNVTTDYLLGLSDDPRPLDRNKI